jgi:hypothetical protein
VWWAKGSIDEMNFREKKVLHNGAKVIAAAPPQEGP